MKIIRSVTAIAVGAALLTGVAVVNRANIIQAAPAAAPSPNCANVQVMVTPYRSDAAMGHIGMMYQVHNLWNSACKLYGYPGVKLLDKNFNTMSTSLSWQKGPTYLTRMHKPVTVTLAPGGNAYFLLESSDMPTAGQQCPAVHYLMITPPNDRLPVVTYAAKGNLSFTPCGGVIMASSIQPNAFQF